MANELYVGITTWNDEIFLPYCLEALKKTLEGIDYKIFITDNGSEDNTLDIARQYTKYIRVKRETQPNALNFLVSQSKAERTLLIHSDVIMLSHDWYQLCNAYLNNGSVLVSPEDIGLGNYQRTFGAGKPESSFMLYDTAWLKRVRRFYPKRLAKRLLRRPNKAFYGFDFYGEHVTYNIPKIISNGNRNWTMMKVHPSTRQCTPIHVSGDSKWMADPAFRSYGYGNFYSVDGVVTHYHNWFARWESQFGVGNSKWGVPASMIKSYSLRFLEDYKNDSIEYPITNKRIDEI